MSPSSQGLCVNIAHIRSKTFCCSRKYREFVEVSFQVLQKNHVADFQRFSNECVLQLSPKHPYQRINHCIYNGYVFTCRAYSRKIEHPGIERFTKSALFEKNFFFLNLHKMCQNILQLGGFKIHRLFWIVQVPFCQTF